MRGLRDLRAKILECVLWGEHSFYVRRVIKLIATLRRRRMKKSVEA